MNYITLAIIAVVGIAFGIYFGRRSAKKSHDAATHDAPIPYSREWTNKEENCACGKKMEPFDAAQGSNCACANGKVCTCGGTGDCKKGATLIAQQGEAKEQNKQKILEFLQTHERVQNNDVEKLVGVSDATAERYLSELEREGVLTQHGDEGSGVFYTKK